MGSQPWSPPQDLPRTGPIATEIALKLCKIRRPSKIGIRSAIVRRVSLVPPWYLPGGANGSFLPPWCLTGCPFDPFLPPMDPVLPPWCLPGCPNGSFLPPWCLAGSDRSFPASLVPRKRSNEPFLASLVPLRLSKWTFPVSLVPHCQRLRAAL